MLAEICAFLRNWFERDKLFGDFVISNGQITWSDGSALPLLSGQYYRIVGSIFNDGVHIIPVGNPQTPDPLSVLQDEEFSGAVWPMAVPPAFLALAGEIKSWVTANAQAIASPYQSESFAGYSYSLKSGAGATDGSGGIGWQTQFLARLNPWRKI